MTNIGLPANSGGVLARMLHHIIPFLVKVPSFPNSLVDEEFAPEGDVTAALGVRLLSHDLNYAFYGSIISQYLVFHSTNINEVATSKFEALQVKFRKIQSNEWGSGSHEAENYARFKIVLNSRYSEHSNAILLCHNLRVLHLLDLMPGKRVSERIKGFDLAGLHKLQQLKLTAKRNLFRLVDWEASRFYPPPKLRYLYLEWLPIEILASFSECSALETLVLNEVFSKGSIKKFSLKHLTALRRLVITASCGYVLHVPAPPQRLETLELYNIKKNMFGISAWMPLLCHPELEELTIKNSNLDGPMVTEDLGFFDNVPPPPKLKRLRWLTETRSKDSSQRERLLNFLLRSPELEDVLVCEGSREGSSFDLATAEGVKTHRTATYRHC